MKKLCRSCSGPLDEFDPKDLKHPDFCPYCVDEKGELKNYKEILEGMIDYIKNDHKEIEPARREEQAVTWLREGPVWGAEFKGTIIEESLEDTSIFDKIEITSERRSDEPDDPSENHGFPVWNLKDVHFFRTELEQVVDFLKKNLKEGPWWVDLSSEDEIYIIFRDRVFKGKSTDTRFKKNVNEYAGQVGCPESQFPFRETGSDSNRQYKAKEWIT